MSDRNFLYPASFFFAYALSRAFKVKLKLSRSWCYHVIYRAHESFQSRFNDFHRNSPPIQHSSTLHHLPPLKNYWHKKKQHFKRINHRLLRSWFASEDAEKEGCTMEASFSQRTPVRHMDLLLLYIFYLFLLNNSKLYVLWEMQICTFQLFWHLCESFCNSFANFGLLFFQ